MNKICFYLILFLFFASICDDDVLNKVVDKYSKISSFEANFKQTIKYHKLKRESISQGYVIFKKPDKFKWVQLKPEESQYVSDGSKVWLYIKDEDDIFEYNEAQIILDKVKLFFFSDKEFLKKFNITRDTNFKDNNYVKYILEPKESDNFLKAFIFIKVKDYLISKISIIDLAKNDTSVSLEDIKFNKIFSDDIFKLNKK